MKLNIVSVLNEIDNENNCVIEPIYTDREVLWDVYDYEKWLHNYEVDCMICSIKYGIEPSNVSPFPSSFEEWYEERRKDMYNHGLIAA